MMAKEAHDYTRPLGVVIGSDRQGGQHQGRVGGRGVDVPVDYTVTILVDGLCHNMLNLWPTSGAVLNATVLGVSGEGARSSK